MSATKRYLAFDLGASNGRAVLGEWDGSRLNCSDIYHFPNDPVHVHGNTYWDVLRLLHEVRNGLLKYSSQYGSELDGIGIDTWGVDFGLIDRDGRLLGNPHHHRDARFADVAEGLKELVGGYEVYAETGVFIEQVATITQLYALSKDNSHQLKSAQNMLMIPSILNYFLTGKLCDEHSNISNTGLIGFKDGKPLIDLLRKMGVDINIIPEYVRPGATLGEVVPALKQDVGLTSAPVIACATHDTASAVISVPAVPSSNWAFLSCGTWSVLGIETSQPVTSRESYNSGLTTAATADGKFMTRRNIIGLWIVQELRRLWNQSGADLGYAEMVEMAETAHPFSSFIDVDDPVFVQPSDMACAVMDYTAKTGQNIPSDRGTMLRVVFESMAMKYRQVVEIIRSVTGAKIEVLHVVGGGARNAFLCQCAADALGIPVVAGPVEATSMGNLLMQMKGSGEISSVEEGRALLGSSFGLLEYVPQSTSVWDEAYSKYLKIIGRD